MAERFPPLQRQRFQSSQSVRYGGRGPDRSNDKGWHVDRAVLETNGIERNTKRDSKFQKAPYYCPECNFYIFNENDFRKHIDDKMHKSRLKMHKWDEELKSLPYPDATQINAVSQTILDIYENDGMNDEEKRLRSKVVTKLERLLQEKFPDVILSIFGSSSCGFGLKTSDININLGTTSGTSEELPYLLEKVFTFLKAREGKEFADVKSDFKAQFPVIRMIDIKTTWLVEVTIYNQLSVYTSRLLEIYSSLHEHVEKLVVAFRHWAQLTQLCRNDQKDKAPIPANALSLMVIFFLQQKHFIPVIDPPQVRETETVDFEEVFDDLFEEVRLKVLEKPHRRNQQKEIGKLWLAMLKFYCLDFKFSEKVVSIDGDVPPDEKAWKNKKLKVRDPYKHGTNTTHKMQNNCLHNYWQESIHKAYEFFARLRRTSSAPKSHRDSFTSSRDTDSWSDISMSSYTEHLHDKGPTLVCTSCNEEGHLSNICPEDELPNVSPLSQLSVNQTKIITGVLRSVQDQFALSEIDEDDRQRFLVSLKHFIREAFPDAELQLFGSSANGFGLLGSDMDISLKLTKEISDEDKPETIAKLAGILKRNPELQNVNAITTAKVPIVKFHVKKLGLEADISLYNDMTARNTRLLLLYTQIDLRVGTMGCALKHFVKTCDIGDADRGSLSSYAYILMMLYFLQQVEPPVIPVLQELYDDLEKPMRDVDISELDKLWPYRGHNKMSEGELWLGFFNFYLQEFNAEEFVISIRQKEPLRRFYKGWQGLRFFAIEDPFETSRNLASAPSKKMTLFILKTLRNGRIRFGTPADVKFRSTESALEYFFNREKLSEERPQTAHGCFKCGKYGHEQKDCPDVRKERKEARANRRGQQQQQQGKM